MGCQCPPVIPCLGGDGHGHGHGHDHNEDHDEDEDEDGDDEGGHDRVRIIRTACIVAHIRDKSWL